MKIFKLILLVFVLSLYSCNQIPQRIRAITNPYVYVSPFEIYNGEYKTIDFKTFTLQFPEGVRIDSQTFNGFMYLIDANGVNHYKIIVLPFAYNTESAGFLLGGSTLYYPSLQFKEGNIKGVYYNNGDEKRNPLKYETFCYIKHGYTFYIYSYGSVDDYYSAFDVVKSTKVLSNPISSEVKKDIVIKLTEEYKEKLLPTINSKFQERIYKDVKLLDSFYCKEVKTSIENKDVKIDCIIDGDYSQLYSGQKSIINNILNNVDFSRSYGNSLTLLGYNLIFNFRKTSGEKI